MPRLVLPTSIEVIPQLLHDLLAKRQLLRLGKTLMDTRLIGHRLRHDRLHQRHEIASQLRKQRAHRRRLHPVIGKINQRIGNVIVPGKKFANSRL